MKILNNMFSKLRNIYYFLNISDVKGCAVRHRFVRFAFCLLVGGAVNNSAAIGGAFTSNLNNTPSNSNWNIGSGIYLSKIWTFLKCSAQSIALAKNFPIQGRNSRLSLSMKFR